MGKPTDKQSQLIPVSKQRNRIETMGLTATLGPFVGFNSSSRVQMLSSHVSQAIAPAKPDIPRAMTGFETQLAEHTFNIKMPTDGIVKSIHRKYRGGVGQAAINKNPTTTIIYQCQDTGRYDYISICEIETRHKAFAVKYLINPAVDRLREGSAIPAGTVLASSPNIMEGEIYATGLETSVAYLAVPGVIEDGFVVSESYCLRASPLEIGSSIVEWGRRSYPLNLYGDENHYKPFPEIGDTIRADGLVFALRDYDSMFDAIEMTPAALMEVDMVSDRRIYGVGGATVYDITVESGIGESRSRPVTPAGMEIQADRYRSSATEYYEGIRKVYDQLERENKRGFVLSPKLQNLVVRAIADQPNAAHARGNRSQGIIRRTFKNQPLDEWRVEIKFEKLKPVKPGSKMTDRHGGKGVICAIWPDSHMPVDKDGNVADVLAFAKGAVSRLNVGQFYEHYVNAASRDMSKWVQAQYGKVDNSVIWERVMTYYKAAAPQMAGLLERNYTSKAAIDNHIQSIVESGIYLYISPVEEHLGPQMVRNIDSIIKPTYGPVSYVNSVGERVITRDPCFIGIKDMIILEKTDQKPMAVSSATLQHHGMISGATRESRNAHPSKQQSTRVLGETECRLFSATMGGDICAEMLDLANSPESHREAVYSILAADKPSRIDSLVDREKNPIGRSRPLAFVTHLLAASGTSIENNTGDK